jgi:hypothetical protein
MPQSETSVSQQLAGNVPFTTVRPCSSSWSDHFWRYFPKLGRVLLKPEYGEIWVQRPIETPACGFEYPQ